MVIFQQILKVYYKGGGIMSKDNKLQLLELINQYINEKADCCMKNTDFEAIQTVQKLVLNDVQYAFQQGLLQ